MYYIGSIFGERARTQAARISLEKKAPKNKFGKGHVIMATWSQQTAT